MGLDKQKLLLLNRRGLFPKSEENEKEFLQRIHRIESLYADPEIFFSEDQEHLPFSLDKKLRREDWEWTRIQLKQLFDVSPDWILAGFSNKGLMPWHGAMAWFFETPKDNFLFPIIQLRKSFFFRKIFRYYKQDDILAHEAVHCIRMIHKDSHYEEMLSYSTSSLLMHRAFGPIIEKVHEPFLFFVPLFLFALLNALNGFLKIDHLMVIGKAAMLTSIGVFLFGLFRLMKRKHTLKKAFNNLKNYFSDERKARYVLFRLSGEEIKLFSRFSLKEIKSYVMKKIKKDLRWQMIYYTYFSGTSIIKKNHT